MLHKKHRTDGIPDIYKLSTTLLICLIFFACSSKHLDKSEMIDRIEFGHGGGFAGIEYTYILDAAGNLFFQGTESESVTKLPSHQTKQLFKNIEHIFNENEAKDSPGNTYQFITLYEGENPKRWVWNSSNQATLDAQLKINYSILMKFVSKHEHSDNQ